MLAPLLQVLPDSNNVYAILDERLQIPEEMGKSIQIVKVKPSVMHRFSAEQWLANNVTPGDLVLCFGNLPPLFKLKGRVLVFLHNRYLIDDVCLNAFPLAVKVRIAIERLWLWSRISNTDEFIVQTPTMKRLLEARSKGSVFIRILPFVAHPKGYVHSSLQSVELDANGSAFLYVASGEPHKNHMKILEAWCLLAADGLRPTLQLTLDEGQFKTLCNKVSEVRESYSVNVTNLGVLSHEDIKVLYEKVDALIFPSTFEAFGLPLIEARQAGLPILASELDYVRDLINPEQSFDPNSPISIARAVKRFLGVNKPTLVLLDAKGFLEQIIGNVKKHLTEI